MSIYFRLKESRFGEIWLKHKEKIILAIGLILIAAVSFEAGYMKGSKNTQVPVVINEAACAPCPENEAVAAGNEANNSSKENKQSEARNQTSVEAQECAYVASKNSNKYHLPSCRYAQNIKPENRLCFSSKEEAENRGFQGAKCCIK